MHRVFDCQLYAIFCSFAVETYDARTGDKLAVQQFATFERGFGNFGGARTSSAEKPIAPVPKRAPDAVVEQQTSVDQVSAVYTLIQRSLTAFYSEFSFVYKFFESHVLFVNQCFFIKRITISLKLEWFYNRLILIGTGDRKIYTYHLSSIPINQIKEM